jgi:hypothetical protein
MIYRRLPLVRPWLFQLVVQIQVVAVTVQQYGEPATTTIVITVRIRESTLLLLVVPLKTKEIK